MTDDRSRVGHRAEPDQAGTVARTTLSCGAATTAFVVVLVLVLVPIKF